MWESPGLGGGGDVCSATPSLCPVLGEWLWGGAILDPMGKVVTLGMTEQQDGKILHLL